MRFNIKRASTPWRDRETVTPLEGAEREGRDWFVEVGTLEELLELGDRAGADLIIDRECIWIYDDYME